MLRKTFFFSFQRSIAFSVWINHNKPLQLLKGKGVVIFHQIEKRYSVGVQSEALFITLTQSFALNSNGLHAYYVFSSLNILTIFYPMPCIPKHLHPRAHFIGPIIGQPRILMTQKQSFRMRHHNGKTPIRGRYASNAF